MCTCVCSVCTVIAGIFCVGVVFFSLVESKKIYTTRGRWEEVSSVRIRELSNRHSKHLWYYNASHVKHSGWLYTHVLLCDLLDKHTINRKGVNFTIKKFLYGMCTCVLCAYACVYRVVCMCVLCACACVYRVVCMCVLCACACHTFKPWLTCDCGEKAHFK